MTPGRGEMKHGPIQESKPGAFGTLYYRTNIALMQRCKREKVSLRICCCYFVVGVFEGRLAAAAAIDCQPLTPDNASEDKMGDVSHDTCHCDCLRAGLTDICAKHRAVRSVFRRLALTLLYFQVPV
jgi:hypothetical protein